MIIRFFLDWLTAKLLEGYEKQLQHEVLSLENILGYSSIDNQEDIDYYLNIHREVSERLDTIRKTRKYVETNTLI